MKNQFLAVALGATLLLPSCFGGGSGSGNNNGNAENTDNNQASEGQIVKRADGSTFKIGGYKAVSPNIEAPQGRQSAIQGGFASVS